MPSGRRDTLNDQQVLTLAVAIILPAVAVIYSNSRVGDVSKRIDDTNANLGKRMDEMEKRIIERIDNAFTHMGLLLELHEAKHHNKD